MKEDSGGRIKVGKILVEAPRQRNREWGFQ
jgi:hypothetical protein